MNKINKDEDNETDDHSAVYKNVEIYTDFGKQDDNENNLLLANKSG